MSEMQNQNALLGAAVFSQPESSQPPQTDSAGNALVHQQKQPTELANRPPGQLRKPSDDDYGDLIGSNDGDIGKIPLHEVTDIEAEDYESINLEDLGPDRTAFSHHQEEQPRSNMNMNMLGNLNINILQQSLNMVRGRAARPTQRRPQEAPEVPENQPAPEPAREPGEDQDMNFYKPRPNPGRKYLIGSVGVLMASLVTTSSLYGNCAAKQGRSARHTSSRTTKIITPTITSLSTLTSTSQTTTTQSASSTTFSTTATSTQPPTTITISTTSPVTVTSTLVVTPQPIIITNTVVVTPAPVTVTKTRTCIFCT